MKSIPYKKIIFQTKLSETEVIQRLKQLMGPPKGIYRGKILGVKITEYPVNVYKGRIEKNIFTTRSAL